MEDINLKKKSEIEILKDVEDYLTILNSDPSLTELAKVPFTLSLILTIVPKIQE